MTVLKIIGIVIVTLVLKGVHQVCVKSTRDMRSGNFHGQDPKVMKYKYAQLLIFDIVLWLLDAFLVVSLFR
jgi:hypothetical protein